MGAASGKQGDAVPRSRQQNQAVLAFDATPRAAQRTAPPTAQKGAASHNPLPQTLLHHNEADVSSASSSSPVAQVHLPAHLTTEKTPHSEETVMAGDLAFLMNVELLSESDLPADLPPQRPRSSTAASETYSMPPYLTGPARNSAVSTPRLHPGKRASNASVITNQDAGFFMPDETSQASYEADNSPMPPLQLLLPLESTRTVKNRRAREEATSAIAAASHEKRYTVDTEQIDPVVTLKRMFSQGGELRKGKQSNSFFFTPAGQRSPTAGRRSGRPSRSASVPTPQQSTKEKDTTEGPLRYMGAGGAPPHRRSEVGGTSHFALSLEPADGAADVYFYDVVSNGDNYWDFDDSSSDNIEAEEEAEEAAAAPRASLGSEARVVMTGGGRPESRPVNSHNLMSGTQWSRQATGVYHSSEHIQQPGHFFTAAPAFRDDADSSEESFTTTGSSGDDEDEDEDRHAKRASRHRGSLMTLGQGAGHASQRTSLYSLGPMRASVRLADGKLHNVLLLPKPSMKADSGRPSHPVARADVSVPHLKSADPSPNGPAALLAAHRMLDNSFFTEGTNSTEGTHMRDVFSTLERNPTMGMTSEQLSVHSSGDDEEEEEGEASHSKVPSSPSYSVSEGNLYGAQRLLTPFRIGEETSGAAEKATTKRMTRPARSLGATALNTATVATRRFTTGPQHPLHGSPIRFTPMGKPPVPSSDTQAQRQLRLSQSAPVYLPMTPETAASAPAPARANSVCSTLLDRATVQRMRLLAAKEVRRFSLTTARYVASPDWHALEPGDDEDEDEDEERRQHVLRCLADAQRGLTDSKNVQEDDEDAGAALIEVEQIRLGGIAVVASPPRGAPTQHQQHTRVGKPFVPLPFPKAPEERADVFVPMQRIRR